VFGLNR